VILYADTSAVVKALLLESGSSDVDRWFEEADEVAASVITYAESCAAVGRSMRMSDRDDATRVAALATLDKQWNEFFVLPVPERESGQVALKHGLRGMDAVQLATAIGLRTFARANAPTAEVVVASFDRRLLEAAEREGFATLGGPLSS
jgi:predicted nucleic acid-binding protein